jgi:hypothetical protein
MSPLRALTAIAVLLLLLLPGVQFAVAAQQRPFTTEDPEAIGAGRIMIESGVDYDRSVTFSSSGLTGHLLSVPTLGISFGVSSIAEVQIDGGFYQRMSITNRVPAPLTPALAVIGDRTSAVRDLMVATKVRVVGETATRPSLAIRMATRIPSASAESGLGKDATEFNGAMLIAKSVENARIVANVGFVMLEDATRPARQDDLLTYGLSVAAAVGRGAEVVAEINGRANFNTHVVRGSESRGVLRVGTRWTRGTVRLDAAAVVGMTDLDPTVGLTAGFTWVFNAFTIP